MSEPADLNAETNEIDREISSSVHVELFPIWIAERRYKPRYQALGDRARR